MPNTTTTPVNAASAVDSVDDPRRRRWLQRLLDNRDRLAIAVAVCEAHHLRPWVLGGRTDLADGVLICSHHHHRAHDLRYESDRMPNGDLRFHRRT